VGLHQPEPGGFLRQLAAAADLSLIAVQRRRPVCLRRPLAPGETRRAGLQRTASGAPPLPRSQHRQGRGACWSWGWAASCGLIRVPTPAGPAPWWRLRRGSGPADEGKFFAAHLVHRGLCRGTGCEQARKTDAHFYELPDGAMAAPRLKQSVDSASKTCSIRTIAPGIGPGRSSESWRSLLADYRRWGESQGKAQLSCGPALGQPPTWQPAAIGRCPGPGGFAHWGCGREPSTANSAPPEHCSKPSAAAMLA